MMMRATVQRDVMPEEGSAKVKSESEAFKMSLTL